MARKNFANAQFEVSGGEGLEIVDELYNNEEIKQQESLHDVANIQDIKEGLQQPVQALS